jgi:DNA-binding NarL/FixJ family response regulator
MPTKLYVVVSGGNEIQSTIMQWLDKLGYKTYRKESLGKAKGIYLIAGGYPLGEGLVIQPDQRVIMVVPEARTHHLYTIARFRLQGCIQLIDTIDHIQKTIETNLQSKNYFTSAILKRLFDPMLLQIGDRLHALTVREVQIIELISEGCSNEHISEILGIGVRTVNTHKRNVLKKTSLRLMEQVIAHAIRYGII